MSIGHKALQHNELKCFFNYIIGKVKGMKKKYYGFCNKYQKIE